MFVSSDCVKCVAFDPQKSNILASCSDDKTIKIWDIDSGSCLSTLTGHSERVNCVVFSPNGKVIASCSGQGYNIDNSVRLWDAATGAAIGSPLRGHRYDPFPCIECNLL
jgi:WD40 repeat protein